MPDSTGPASSHRLRQAMQLRGIGSAAELARLTNQNEVTVRSHVNGTRDVSKRAAEAYSRALNIDPAWLLYGHGPAPDGTRRTFRSDPATESRLIRIEATTLVECPTSAPPSRRRRTSISCPKTFQSSEPWNADPMELSF